MQLKDLKLSPFLSVFGIIIVFFLLSGLIMSLGLLFPDSNFIYVIGIIGVGLFVLATFRINTWYFNKINLIPPKIIRLNKTFLIKIGIGFSFALILCYTTRIFWSINTESLKYLVVVFSLESFAKLAIFQAAPFDLSQLDENDFIRVQVFNVVFAPE